MFLSFVGGLSVILFVGTAWTLLFPAQLLVLPVIALALWEAIESKGEGLKQFFHGQPLLIFILLLACLLPSVLEVWINDDSAYYLPSIKWYAEEGFVKGLSRWNTRYGLASSWHLLSAMFYWEGISPDRVWNFNGLLLFLFCSDLIKRTSNLLLVAPVLILCAPFLNAPSPDLPIILLTVFVILYHSQLSPREWAYFLLFAFGIKATGLSLLLVAIYPLLKCRLQFLRYAWILLPMAALWMGKNLLLTGHLLFPVDSVWTGEAQALPKEVLVEFKNGVLAEIYGLGFSGEAWTAANMNLPQRFLSLFTLKPYKVMMNLLILGGGIMLIGYYREEKVQKIPLMSIWVALSLLLWFIMAPNYRFALGIGIGAVLVLFRGQSRIKLNAVLSVFGMLALGIGMVWMNTLGTNYVRVVSCGVAEPLSMNQLLVPLPYPEHEIDKVNLDGIEYYRPGDCIYCGDTPRPCYPDTVKRTHEHFGISPVK